MKLKLFHKKENLSELTRDSQTENRQTLNDKPMTEEMLLLDITKY